MLSSQYPDDQAGDNERRFDEPADACLSTIMGGIAGVRKYQSRKPYRIVYKRELKQSRKIQGDHDH